MHKPSSEPGKLITILKKGINCKCYNERVSRKIAYSFLMTAIPWTDLDINTCWKEFIVILQIHMVDNTKPKQCLC